MNRKAFICKSCEAVYADALVSQCDCMPEKNEFIEAVICLAQPEQVVGLKCANCYLTIEALNDKVLRLMQERQPQPEHIRDATKMMAQPEQEPVAWISKHGVVYPLDAKDEVHPINELQPLYTAPPQRQPLTDERIAELYMSNTDRPMKAYWEFARAIEAAHGIKEAA